MTALHTFGARIGLRLQAAMARAMTSRARCLYCIVRRPHARPRLGVSTTLIVTTTGRLHAHLTLPARLATTGRRRTSHRGVAAPTPRPKDQRLQPFERDL